MKIKTCRTTTAAMRTTNQQDGYNIINAVSKMLLVVRYML